MSRVPLPSVKAPGSPVSPVQAAALGGPYQVRSKGTDGVFKKKAKVKAADSLNLPLFLDPSVVEKATSLSDETGRTWRVMRAKKLQQAHHNNPEKFNEWKGRINKFYKRAVWGPVPKDTTLPTKVHYKSLSPSKDSLWHYYYHAGKTRAERRVERIERIERMRKEQEEKLRQRVQAHKDRLSKFARRGLERREKVATHKRLLEESCRGTGELEALVENADEVAMETEARKEAIICIQAQVRGRITRGKTLARVDDAKSRARAQMAALAAREAAVEAAEERLRLKAEADQAKEADKRQAESPPAQKGAAEAKENAAEISDATADEDVPGPELGPLADGWERQVSKSRQGKTYYFNGMLGLSVWALEDVSAAVDSVENEQQVLPPGWKREMSATQNRPYYFHVLTGRSVWHFNDVMTAEVDSPNVDVVSIQSATPRGIPDLSPIGGRTCEGPTTPGREGRTEPEAPSAPTAGIDGPPKEPLKESSAPTSTPIPATTETEHSKVESEEAAVAIDQPEPKPLEPQEEPKPESKPEPGPNKSESESPAGASPPATKEVPKPAPGPPKPTPASPKPQEAVPDAPKPAPGPPQPQSRTLQVPGPPAGAKTAAAKSESETEKGAPGPPKPQQAQEPPRAEDKSESEAPAGASPPATKEVPKPAPGPPKPTPASPKPQEAVPDAPKPAPGPPQPKPAAAKPPADSTPEPSKPRPAVPGPPLRVAPSPPKPKAAGESSKPVPGPPPAR